jgi:hypothetical protein
MEHIIKLNKKVDKLKLKHGEYQDRFNRIVHGVEDDEPEPEPTPEPPILLKSQAKYP